MTDFQRGELEAKDYAIEILERLKGKFVGNSNTCGTLWARLARDKAWDAAEPWAEQKKAWGLAIAAVDYEIELLNE